MSIEKLNILKRFLQGIETHILQLSDKIAAFKKKLELWKNGTNNEDLACFPQLNSFPQENQLLLPHYLKSAFVDFLAKLSLELDIYYPVSEIESVVWVRNPFIDEVPENLLINEAEQFFDLATDSSMKLKFQALSLIEFWTHAHTAYPLIGIKALRVLIPFATSYLCETGFSVVAAIKTKYRSKLDIDRESRVAISKITPRFNTLCAEKQVHPSH